MVFAKDKPIRIFGEGSGEVTVRFAESTAAVKIVDGKWYAELPAMPYGGPYTLTVDGDGESIKLNNIYVGEVYLCAGQSNMAFKVHESTLPKAEYKANPLLRLFSTDRIRKDDKFSPEDGWVTCEEQDVGFWTAIGYSLAQEISAKKNIAVGIIACYQGASVIESWVPAGTFEKAGVAVDKALSHPDRTWVEFSDFNPDGTLYQYSLSSVFPFSLSAVIWYQGESNSKDEDALNYYDRLKILISRWREDFSDDELMFVIVQIADYIGAQFPVGWKLIQEAQLKVSATESDVKTVISHDLCETDDIHPPTKALLAKRIAQALI